MYNYIDKGVFLNLSNKHLLNKRKTSKQKHKKVSKVALKKTASRSISERTVEINNRENIGNWEMDCGVSGKGLKVVLLVLTERKVRQIIIFKMKDKTEKSVGEVLDKLERKHKYKFKQIYKSITMDNGCEFVNQEAIEKSILRKK